MWHPFVAAPFDLPYVVCRLPFDELRHMWSELCAVQHITHEQVGDRVSASVAELCAVLHMSDSLFNTALSDLGARRHTP